MTALPAAVQESRIAALQRRAQLHKGAARAHIEARLQALRSAMPATDTAPAETPPAPDRISPLAALVAQLARRNPPSGELKAVRDHRSTWVKLGVQQRLTQTLARVPDNAGPLNTQRLMHKALTRMGDASPAYLQHFMAHVEALLALEQLAVPPPAARKDGARAGRGA